MCLQCLLYCRPSKYLNIRTRYLFAKDVLFGIAQLKLNRRKNNPSRAGFRILIPFFPSRQYHFWLIAHGGNVFVLDLPGFENFQDGGA